MPVILPEDNIPASEEITPSANLGLPKIPRANNSALAALNAITRILDGLVLRNDGAVASGHYTFSSVTTPSATISSLNAVTALINSINVQELIAATGDIADLTVQTISADSGTLTELVTTSSTCESVVTSTLEAVSASIATLTSDLSTLGVADIATLTAIGATINSLVATTGTIPNLNSTSATIDNLSCKVGIFDSLILKGSSSANTIVSIGSIGPNYSSTTAHPQAAQLSITPDVVDYSLALTATGALVTGSFNVKTGSACYTVVDKGTAFDYTTTDRTGLGFPKINGDPVFTLEVSEGQLKINGYGIFDYSLAEPFTFTYKATQNRVV